MQIFKQDLIDSLFSELYGVENFVVDKPLLAHYTSVNVLESILSNNEIWFSNPLNMNDVEEVRFGILEGAKAFRQHRGLLDSVGTEKYQKLISYFDVIHNDFSRKAALDIYVLCLSEHNNALNDGLLSMWRGYADNGNGVALVFDSAKLQADPDSPLMLEKVKYASTHERLEWINNKIDEIVKLTKNQSLSDEDLLDIASVYFERIKIFALFTKHIGFSEEKEWRFVYLMERDKNEVLTPLLDYNVGPKGVESKLKFKFEPRKGLKQKNISLETFLKEIILGPTASNPLTLHAVKRMLGKLQRGELVNKLRVSTTPYRSST